VQYHEPDPSQLLTFVEYVPLTPLVHDTHFEFKQFDPALQLQPESQPESQPDVKRPG
jgi:hypothetical protein